MNLLDSEFDSNWQRLFAPVELKVKKFINHQENSQDVLKLVSQWSLVQSLPVRAKSFMDLQALMTRHLDLPSTFHAQEDVQWAHMARKVILFHNYLAEHLISRSFVVSDGFFYWNAVLGSRRLLYSHGLSVFPVRCYNFISDNWQQLDRFPAFIVSYHYQLRQDINWKRNQCADIRKRTAALVGFLFQERPFINLNHIRTVDVRKSVSRQLRILSKCVDATMKLSNLDDITSEQGQRSPFQSQEMIASIDLYGIDHDISASAFTLEQAGNLCAELLDRLDTNSSTMEHNFEVVGKPSKWVRSWPKFAFYGCIAWYTLSSIIRNRESLASSFTEIVETSKRFLSDWILEPLANIWKTIRHENTLQLTAGTQGLNADLESLQRMVADYAKDTQALDEDEISALTQRVKSGDLTLLMKDYENDIKQPIKNVFAGQMLRILLIQVQKTKVDLELAMTGIDQMLKSQELNFAFLAIAPTLIISGALANYAASVYSRPDKRWCNKIKASLRNIEKLLILESESDKVSYTVNGMVIVEAFYILKHILGKQAPEEISADKSMTTEILQSDLEDLISEKFTIHMKYMVIQRMMRSLN